MLPLAALALLTTREARASSLDIVKDGKVINLVHPEPGHAFGSRQGTAEVRDARRVFVMDAKLGQDFVVKGRLRIERAEKSAATVVFDDRDMFGFGGSAGKMFLHSARFKGVKLDRPAPKAVLDGKLFDMEICRGPSKFTIRIDGETIVEVTDKVPEIHSLGLRPWNGVMWIESLVITGDVAKDNKAETLRTGNGPADSERNPRNATAGQKSSWAEHLARLQRIDLSDRLKRSVLARGLKEDGKHTQEGYWAHPTTAMLGNGRTILAVWTYYHGGHAGPMARSDDGGITWSRVDDSLPANYWNFKNCPSIYRIADATGKERLWVFAARTLGKAEEHVHDFPGRVEGFMPRIVSEDDGKTWKEMPPLGPFNRQSPWRCVMTFSSMVRLTDGSHLGMFHRFKSPLNDDHYQVMQSISRDGGMTWSEPTVAFDGETMERKKPCEPYVFRSPEGGELCCIMRENWRSGASLMMFSRDEGKTWSRPVDTPWGLTGDRHQHLQLHDGRLLFVFRDSAPQFRDEVKTGPQRFFRLDGFVGWVGTYDDIKQGRPGQYTLRLLPRLGDTGYPGLHQLADKTIVATTYGVLSPGEKPSIVSLRFTMAEVDAWARKAAAAKPAAIDGVDPDDGTGPRPAQWNPPRLITNPDSTAEYARDKRTCTGVPSIAIAPSGRLWAAWFSGKTPGEIIESCLHAYIVVSTSGNGGKTWKEQLAIDPDGAGPLKAYDPRPWVDPEGMLWVFFTMPFPLHKHAWAITAETADRENPRWSKPRPVFEGVLLNAPIVLGNGDWLFPTYARRPANMGAIISHVSRDKGATFGVRGQIEASWDLFPSEPMAIERKDGSLWMLARTTKGIGESLSLDGGVTWSRLRTPVIEHTPSRFFIGRLKSGNLLLVKHLGIGEDPLSAGKANQRRQSQHNTFEIS
ncbi:MAG: exo-alpha-sialidase [Planctomycetota bacterium]